MHLDHKTDEGDCDCPSCIPNDYTIRPFMDVTIDETYQEMRGVRHQILDLYVMDIDDAEKRQRLRDLRQVWENIRVRIEYLKELYKD